MNYLKTNRSKNKMYYMLPAMHKIHAILRMLKNVTMHFIKRPYPIYWLVKYIPVCRIPSKIYWKNV